MFRRIKWAYQRIKYGVSDWDIVSFDSYLSTIIIRGLKKSLISSGFGTPFGDDKDCSKITRIYEDIIFTFEVQKKLVNMEVVLPEQGQSYEDYAAEYKKIDEHMDTKEEIDFWGKNDWKFSSILISKEDYKRYQRGWKYFKQYFGCFWV